MKTMDNGVLIVKACVRTTSHDREVMYNDICKQLENSNVVVLPLEWNAVYYPPGTEVVVDTKEGRTPMSTPNPALMEAICKHIANGTPLDSDSDRAEAQAYFDGQAYGWEQGRKALIEDVKLKIETNLRRLYKELMDILDSVEGKESEE